MTTPTQMDADAFIARARAAVTALREANVVLTRERSRLQAANRTMANQERSA